MPTPVVAAPSSCRAACSLYAPALCETALDELWEERVQLAPRRRPEETDAALDRLQQVVAGTLPVGQQPEDGALGEGDLLDALITPGWLSPHRTTLHHKNLGTEPASTV